MSRHCMTSRMRNRTTGRLRRLDAPGLLNRDAGVCRPCCPPWLLPPPEALKGRVRPHTARVFLPFRRTHARN